MLRLRLVTPAEANTTYRHTGANKTAASFATLSNESQAYQEEQAVPNEVWLRLWPSKDLA